ncbi:Outer membrane lipoprotein LolA family carrier protein [Rickettsiales endosymbiont of Paramecium tredecaurelia]|uniref:LolA family protein n=1 Tax=Candidatus Sarmatiella mevalonica TaxID=2770581 RepID=UPI001922FC82|nr:outer membrane lipoprotein carrier protein LolA [Candidatus Sarmatiella mevalonica]MBL3284475.1 Outer membrane lipoprotein LolA family carrier protein [Candidatus Sarmatiella mevalonica]
MTRVISILFITLRVFCFSISIGSIAYAAATSSEITPDITSELNVSSTDANALLDQTVVQMICDYLTQHNKLSIDFTQIDCNGTTNSGKILIDKPCKFRLNYYAPFPLLIIGDKKRISVYDYDMEQVTILDASQNMLSILLDDTLDLASQQELRISKALSDGTIAQLEVTNDSVQKSIVFVFDIVAQKLTKIILLENEIETCLDVINIKPVQHFNQKLFEFRSPLLYGPPRRLNKQQIEKMTEFAEQDQE